MWAPLAAKYTLSIRTSTRSITVPTRSARASHGLPGDRRPAGLQLPNYPLLKIAQGAWRDAEGREGGLRVGLKRLRLLRLDPA
jgi:hypothetical protein